MESAFLPVLFTRLFHDRISGIYPRVSRSRYSMPDGNYSHLGKSLFRSRHYRVTVLRYLDEVSRGSLDRSESSSSSPSRFCSRVEKDLPILLFSCALFRPQSTCDIADSKALPQTTLLLLVRVNVDPGNDTSSSLVIV